MTQHFLNRAIPNQKGQLILEFRGPQHRIFDLSVLWQGQGWGELAYPQHINRLSVAEDGILWPNGRKVDANDLYQRSNPIDQADLERQIILLSYKNQAPTTKHKSHHVYGVDLAPYSTKPFWLGESIAGGIAEYGDWHNLSRSELVALPEWRRHFALSGCLWAAKLIESLGNENHRLLDALVAEACNRNGLPESV